MHEIITLQFGAHSNYIGTHFWNAQEAYFTYSGEEESAVDHDVNFRPGIGADGAETYTPRAVIYDIKENFGTLRSVNALYELQEQENADINAWNNSPIIHQHPIIPPHPYQVALDAGNATTPPVPSTVRYWSDFNRVYYHPRSLVQLNAPSPHVLSSRASQLVPLDLWEKGEELFQTEDSEHDVIDRDIRRFVEESDSLQGFQVIMGADDAWAGFGSRYIERLRDEYGRKSIHAWGDEANDTLGQSMAKRMQRTLNLARSASILSAQASLYIPISNLPAAHDARSPSPYPRYMTRESIATGYQSSGLQAAAFESATLLTRLRIGRVSMAELEDMFTAEVRRNILQLSLSADEAKGTVPLVNGFHDEDSPASEESVKLDISLFRPEWPLGPPSVASGRSRREHIFDQVVLSRGLPHYTIPNSSRALHGFSVPQLFPLPSSFPAIFSVAGSVGSHNRGGDEEDMERTNGIKIRAALTSSSSVAARLRFLADAVRIVPGIREEKEELRSNLLAGAEEYVEGWESESDEEDD